MAAKNIAAGTKIWAETFRMCAELARPQCQPIATPRRQRWDRRRPQGSNAAQDILGHGDCGKVAEKEGPLEITASEPAENPETACSEALDLGSATCQGTRIFSRYFFSSSKVPSLRISG
jgi:hypothetical protein